MSAGLDVRHLKMIYTIANSRSVKCAADALFITQPALSNRIKEAEKRLGCQLFVRRGRKLVITHAGERLLLSASRIIEELERAEHDISRLSTGIEHILRVSLPYLASFAWMPECIKDFAENFPNVELEITTQTSLDPIQVLKLGGVDVAITTNPIADKQLSDKIYSSTKLHKDEWVAILPKGHRLSKKPFLVAQDFVEEAYITNSTVPQRGREYELLFKPEGVTPHKVFQVGFLDAIIEMVHTGAGLSIINRWALESRYQKTEIDVIPLNENGLYFHWYAIYIQDEILTHSIDLLCQHIAQTSP